ncbi:unnamed protein product [Oncorhynchus mykiss]|uniref:TRPM-like domain-containing protein n=1 Tax=Oncorhynchus mykiss TaxID=8022 RepID=A0A060X7H1_ONCMY|nr:unnamed protein product [Oncorhynchus mykiss]
MEWHQAPGNQVFDVFDTIPLIPLQPLPRARPPQLRCHQPPVLCLSISLSPSSPSFPASQVNKLCLYRRQRCLFPWDSQFVWAVLQNLSEMALYFWEMVGMINNTLTQNPVLRCFILIQKYCTSNSDEIQEPK